MDSSHVALVTLRLDSTGFETYRCDRSTNLGINLAHFAKIVKCAGNDDTLSLQFPTLPSLPSLSLVGAARGAGLTTMRTS